MSWSPRSLAAQIASQKEELARIIIDEQWARNLELERRYGESGRLQCVQKTVDTLAYLADSVSAESLPLFGAYIEWIKILFEGLRIPIEDFAETLTISADVLSRRFPESALLLRGYFDFSAGHLANKAVDPPSFIDETQPFGAMARQYLGLLRDGKRLECSQLILTAVDRGIRIQDIYLNVFQPCLRETGRLGQTNQLSVAEEHYCTAATQLIMSQLSTHIFNTKRIGKSLVATCVGGELHEIGLRMVADFFEIAGWDTYYLGSNTPSAVILQTLNDRQADVLAISATMISNVELVTSLIEQVRKANSRPQLKILVGGYPFNVDRDLWRRTGADAYGASALDVVSLCDSDRRRLGTP